MPQHTAVCVETKISVCFATQFIQKKGRLCHFS